MNPVRNPIIPAVIWFFVIFIFVFCNQLPGAMQKEIFNNTNGSQAFNNALPIPLCKAFMTAFFIAGIIWAMKIGKYDRYKEELNKQDKGENSTEIVTPSGNVFKFSSTETQIPTIEKNSVAVENGANNIIANKTVKSIGVLVTIIALVFAVATIAYMVKKESNFSKSEITTNQLPDNSKQKEIPTTVNPANTASDLFMEMAFGNSKVYRFEEIINRAGINLKIKYPKSMNYFPGDNINNIAAFSILNQDSLEFVCAVYLVKEKQKGKATTIQNLMQFMLSTMQYKYTNFKLLYDTGEVSIASLHSVYADCFFESTSVPIQQPKTLPNTDDYIKDANGTIIGRKPTPKDKVEKADVPTIDTSLTTKQICRIYDFYYKGGEGNIQFYLNSSKLNEQELQKAFNDFKPVITEMVNSIQLYKLNEDLQ